MNKKIISYLIKHSCLMFAVFLLQACEDNAPQKTREHAASHVMLNAENGYEINQLTNEPVEAVLNYIGDTMTTGEHFELSPKAIHPDSLKPPTVIKAGSGKVIPSSFKSQYEPKKIDTVLVEQDSITVIPVAQDQTDKLFVTSFGDTIKTGVPVKIEGTKIRSSAPKTVKALAAFYLEGSHSDLQSIDVAQGLNSSFIEDFLQDEAGNLWFATAGAGIGKYDGVNFYFYGKEHGLSHEQARGLEFDADGNIWIVTDGGLNKFDGEYFTQYTEKEGFIQDRGICIIRDSLDNMWWGSNSHGIAKYDGEHFTFYTEKEGNPARGVQELVAGSAGEIWFTTKQHGLINFNGEIFKIYDEHVGISSNRGGGLCADQNGGIWYNTLTDQIDYLKDGQIIHYGVLDGLKLSDRRNLYSGKSGLLVIGSSLGASVFDGQTVRRFSEKEGQKWNNVSGIIEDNVGNIWLGTYGAGMIRLKDKSFSHMTTDHGLPEDVVFDIYEDSKGNIWFGSNNKGVLKYDGDQYIQLTEEDGLCGNRIRAIYEDRDGNMWFGTNHNGVSKYDGEFFTNYNEEQGLSHNIVKSILQDVNGNIWFGTFTGITKFDGENFFHFTREEGFYANRVWSIIQDRDDNLWFCTDRCGVFKYNGETFFNYSEREGLSSNHVWGICEDAFGNIWMGTNDQGVIKFDGDKFQYITENGGITDNQVQSIVLDNSNNVWVGTDRGLSVIDNHKADNNADFKIRNFSYVDGLKALDFNTTSACADENNNMWLATGQGITTINSDFINFSYYEPDVQLNYLTIKDEKVDYRNEAVKEHYKLKYSGVAPYHNYPIKPIFHHATDHLTFYFSAIEWSAPHRILYSFKLDGLSDGWSTPSNETRADFRNLSPGKYTFMVRAMGDNEEWSEPFTYTFTISTPWWMTNLAKIIYGLLFILMVMLIIRLRTRRLNQKKMELELQVAAATTQIRQQKSEVEEAKAIIEHNHQQIKDSIRYSKKIQNSLLLSPQEIKKFYANFFLLFEPKDIVSGDFYFFRQFGDIDYIACVDCTGHGVPGGFMSTLSYLLLDKIIQDDRKKPGEVMDELSEQLIQTLHQQDPDSIQDGMDMSLCRVDRSKGEVQFSGARNGVLVIDESGVAHHAPDYLPVGGNYEKKGQPIERKFRTETLDIKAGQWVVLYTDGYVEQLGGVDGLPMRSKQYEAILQKATQKGDQEAILNYLRSELGRWQRNTPRIDDVCLIGFQI